MFEERGPEPDRKFVDLEFENFARHVMPEFVHRDDDQQMRTATTTEPMDGKYARPTEK